MIRNGLLKDLTSCCGTPGGSSSGLTGPGAGPEPGGGGGGLLFGFVLPPGGGGVKIEFMRSSTFC